MIEVRITLREPHYQFGFDHGLLPPATAGQTLRGCGTNLPNLGGKVNRQSRLSRSRQSILAKCSRP
jgi:hypothetical protein